MSSHHHELSDEETLLDLLRLIVTRHPSATSAIDDTFRRLPHLATSYLTFNFKETGSKLDQECRCHYEHEYMTYIKDTGIDFESFSHVTKNVIRGYCRHARPSDSSPTSRTSPTTPITSMNSQLNLRNIRRYSVDFDLANNNSNRPEKRLVKRRSSSSLKSLELIENNYNHTRGLSGVHSKWSASNTSLKSLTLEIEEVVGQTQTSLMHAAAAVGDGSLLMFLLKKARVSLEQLGKFQLSPLHLAIVKNKMAYLRQIILRPEIYLCNRSGLFKYAQIKNDNHGHTSLEINKISLVGLCIKKDDFDTLHDLLNTGVLSDAALQRGLKETIEENSVDATEIMFKHGVRPDIDIMKIAASKSVEIFDNVFRRFRKDFKIYSIQHPEYITRELLMPAILTRNFGVVQALVKNGAPVTCKGFYTPLTLAVLENQPEITRLLLENHAEKHTELQGYNLLDISTCMGYRDCSEVLRQFGMKKKCKSPKSFVPCNLLLGMASKLDLQQDLVKLRHQLELKQHSMDDETVLHVAVKTRLSRRLVGELLKLGSDVNARNKKLETPLMCAVSKEINSDPDVIREILYYNPVLEQHDKAGKTTLALAMARDHAERSANQKNGNSGELTDSLATLLLDCGYNVKYDNVKKPHHTVYALRAVWKDLAATIGCGRDGLTIQQNPKSLQARCREVVRRSYPGIRLHKFLEFMKVPPEISDFVLFVDLLKVDRG